MATPFIAGVAVAATALAGKYGIQAWQAFKLDSSWKAPRIYLAFDATEAFARANVYCQRLNKGKGMLSSSEKLQLWDDLKILSFTRMVLSLWSVTILSLYIRVQVNIFGKHLYVDTARALGSSHLLEELDLIDRDDDTAQKIQRFKSTI